jgi:hypothetical protein
LLLGHRYVRDFEQPFRYSGRIDDTTFLFRAEEAHVCNPVANRVCKAATQSSLGGTSSFDIVCNGGHGIDSLDTTPKNWVKNGNKGLEVSSWASEFDENQTEVDATECAASTHLLFQPALRAHVRQLPCRRFRTGAHCSAVGVSVGIEKALMLLALPNKALHAHCRVARRHPPGDQHARNRTIEEKPQFVHGSPPDDWIYDIQGSVHEICATGTARPAVPHFVIQKTATVSPEAHRRRRAPPSALIHNEGDSCKALAVGGLAVVGPDKYGIFPLREKLLNVRDVGHTKVGSEEREKRL